jgi:hypothetical protein
MTAIRQPFGLPSFDERPETAHLARFRAPRRRSLNLTDTGRSGQPSRVFVAPNPTLSPTQGSSEEAG